MQRAGIEPALVTWQATVVPADSRYMVSPGGAGAPAQGTYNWAPMAVGVPSLPGEADAYPEGNYAPCADPPGLEPGL